MSESVPVSGDGAMTLVTSRAAAKEVEQREGEKREKRKVKERGR